MGDWCDPVVGIGNVSIKKKDRLPLLIHPRMEKGIFRRVFLVNALN